MSAVLLARYLYVNMTNITDISMHTVLNRLNKSDWLIESPTPEWQPWNRTVYCCLSARLKNWLVFFPVTSLQLIFSSVWILFSSFFRYTMILVPISQTAGALRLFLRAGHSLYHTYFGLRCACHRTEAPYYSRESRPCLRMWISYVAVNQDWDLTMGLIHLRNLLGKVLIDNWITCPDKALFSKHILLSHINIIVCIYASSLVTSLLHKQK
jgi:hypothetical protein